MFRIFCFLIVLSITISAQSKPYIYIDGGKGCNCTLSDSYDDLALAIQNKVKVSERGTFWLVMGKNKEGKVVAQTIGIKGSTSKMQRGAIEAAENHKFKNDFDLLMLRVNSEAKIIKKKRVRR